MEISGKVFTEKKEAGVALLAVCKDIKSVDAAMDIGSYQGFNMRIQFDSWSKEFILSVKHESVAKVRLGADALGNITRINNLLESYPEKLAEAEYILAENAFQNALEEKENPSAVSILSDGQIKTNLLVIANAQNDFAATSSVLSILSDDDDLSDTDSLRLYTTIIGNYMQVGIELDEEELQEIKGLARELCEGIISEDNSLDGTAIV